MYASLSQETTSASGMARKARPVNTLSTPRATIPAKKHHVAREGFLRSRLTTARSRLQTPAAKGRRKKSVIVPGVSATTATRTAVLKTARKRWDHPCGESDHRSYAARYARRASR